MNHKLLRPLYDLVFHFLFTLGGGELSFNRVALEKFGFVAWPWYLLFGLNGQIGTESLLPRFALDQMLANL
jgi:hypothetical protein